MPSVTPNSFRPLLPGELVDDRALDAFGADSFGHGDFVRELAGMLDQARTPANIALFGAWGSGKSSIANLLREELPTDESQVRLVAFDASKYAEAPLRRHFISQVARGLNITDDRYHRGLYTGVETRDVKFRPGEWSKLTGAFLLAVVLTLAILLTIAAVVAALSAGSFESNWSSILKDYLLATLPVAAVITAFIKLAADGFHIKTTRSAPSGDEEFERLFKDLVAEAKTQRLVIFIDELDRCSPEQVASTLETLKTFLFVEGCVFIVAADQQVLEQALRRKARQHTPEDTSNPYYSAGSSYLDKVFQYQLTLPPLRAPALTRFALGLVHDSPGVWQRVPTLDEAVSVLIPTHVVSPRRVKVLLNRFAIAYRIAERRAGEGRLDPDIGARASELAKLVCLQTEFPLFAEDLTLDGRLPELVRMAADKEELPATIRPEVAQRAMEYGRGSRIVAELLVDADTTTDAPAASALEPEDDDPVADTDATLADDDQRTSRGKDVAREHALQLVNYLRKTRHVKGPAPDLLYLESAGADHGIDVVLSDRLQRAALDNDIVGVLQLVAEAADDGQGRGALLVLADVVRQAEPGVGGRNVISALLQAIEHSGVELAGEADPIADAVAGHLARAELAGDDLLGALALARASSRAVGPLLIAAVLAHPDATTRSDVAVALLDRAPDVPKNLRTTLAVAAKTALLEAPEEAAAQLSALPPDEARQLLLEATTPMQAASNAHYAAVEAQEADESAAGVLEPAPHEALATAYDLLIAQAQGTGDEHAASVLGVELVRVMLALDHMELRAAASHRLADHAPIEDADLIGKVLAATARRTVGKWPLWLDPLSAATIGTDDSLSEQAGSLAATLWTKLTGDEAPSDSDAELAISALARCATDASSHTELQAAVHEALDAPLMTSAVIASQEATLQHACQMASAGLLDRSALADMVLGGVAQTLEEATLAVQSYSATPTSIRVAEQPVVVAAVLARVREEAPYATAPTIQRVLKAAPVAATWLSAAELGNVQVASAAALRTRDPDASCPVTLDALHDLAATAGAEETVDDTLALWLEHFSETPEDAWHLVEPLVDNELPPKTSAALSSFAQQVDGSGRFVLIEQALQRTIAKPVHRSFFAAARLSEVPAPKAAERLGQLFDVAGDDTGWRGVLDVWQQLSPTGEAAQRRLVDEVYLPLIRSGDVGLDLAISFFGLVANVKGVRKRVTEALKLAAKTDGQKRSVDERLLSAKWKRRSLFGFGPAVDADEQP